MKTKKTLGQELQDWINKPVLERIEEVHGCLPVYAVNMASPYLNIHQVTDFDEDGSCTIREFSAFSLLDYKKGMMNIPENKGEYGETLSMKTGQKELKTITIPYRTMKVLGIKILEGRFVLLFFRDQALADRNDD